MAAFAYLTIGLCVAVVLLALRMPVLGVTVETVGNRVVVTTADGRPQARLSPEAPVTFAGPAGAFTAPAAELAPDFAPDGPPARVRRWYAGREQLAAIAARPPVTVILPGASPRTLQPRSRRIGDLSLDVWLLLGQGAAIGLLGVWLWAARGSSNGGGAFAASCMGVLLAALSGALFDAREVTADPNLLRVAEALNEIGSNICAAGLAALFLRAPRPLASRLVQAGLIAAAVLAGIARALDWLPLSAFYAGLLVLNGTILAALVAQWMAARRDPAARTVLRWVGATTFVAAAGLAVAMASPALLGLPALGGDGLSFAPLFVVYGGVAFGIGGRRLFDLDRWTYRLMLGVLGALVLLALDAALIGLLDVTPPAAFAVALLSVGYVYLPLRAALGRWMSGGRGLSSAQLFQAATEVALTPQPRDRPARWRALLERLFQPLEIAVTDMAPAGPQRIGPDLVFPPALGEGALRLRHRNRGARLFSAEDVALARELFHLVTWAESARESYARGVVEERQRIARDLHDDVSATLLTSLHRDELAHAQADVRKAMAEIRAAVSSLGGEPMAAGRVLADLRFETAERLASARIALLWPLAASPHDASLMSYAAVRALTASLREIVSNVVRHSGAARVEVTVALAAGRLDLEVRDDGRGLGAVVAGQGSGLRNVRHRISRARGEVILTDATPGLRVHLRVGW